MNCRVAFDDFSRDAARARSAIISAIRCNPRITRRHVFSALFYRPSIDLNYLSTMKRGIKIDPIKLWEIMWKGGRMVEIIGLARSKLV